MSDNSSDSPYRQTRTPRRPPPKGPAHSGRAGTHKQSRPRRRKRRSPGVPKSAKAHHTSQPTTRAAQLTTRAWLLKQYGPTCAYCGGRFAARKMTLDHVAPRRGQTAYDRRDNLVLACGPCNAAKRDQSPLAYLLGVRSRAVNLVKFGAHLSQGLLEMARSLIPSHLGRSSEHRKIDYSRWGLAAPDDDSPYRD